MKNLAIISTRGGSKRIINKKIKDFFDLPIEKNYTKSSWHLYPIRLKEKYKEKKILIFNKSREKGLGS